MLDIGCGKGDLLEHIRVNKLCKEVIGIEFDPNRWVSERPYSNRDFASDIVQFYQIKLVNLHQKSHYELIGIYEIDHYEQVFINHQ